MVWIWIVLIVLVLFLSFEHGRDRRGDDRRLNLERAFRAGRARDARRNVSFAHGTRPGP